MESGAMALEPRVVNKRKRVSEENDDDGASTKRLAVTASGNYSQPNAYNLQQGNYPGVVAPYYGIPNSVQMPEPEKPKPEVFCTVIGRLSINNALKYEVTIDELKRRLGAPECLNSSMITAVLRTAKLSGKTMSMRHELHKRGIELPVGRKKNAETTCFTSLLEEEAAHLAGTVETVTQQHYPVNHLAEHMKNRYLRQCTHPGELEDVKRSVLGAFRTLEAFASVLFAVESPLGARHPEPHPDRCLQAEMDKYSLMTHGFGNLNQRTWLKQFSKVTQTIFTGLQDVRLPPISNGMAGGMMGPPHPAMDMGMPQRPMAPHAYPAHPPPASGAYGYYPATSSAHPHFPQQLPSSAMPYDPMMSMAPMGMQMQNAPLMDGSFSYHCM